MDELSLLNLIARGESLEIEFKSDRDCLSDDALVEAVVCLANSQGGLILIGIEDDGAVTGLHHTRAQVEPGILAAMLANRTVPGCAVTCELASANGKSVMIVQVPRSSSPVSTTSGTFRRRALHADGKPACRPFYYHEMQSRLAALGQLDPSALIVSGATSEDLDPIEIARLRQTIAREGGRAEPALLALSDFELLRTLGLVEGTQSIESVRLAGLLIVGRESSLRRFVPTHRVHFQVLKGLRPEVNESLHSPLIRCAEELLARLTARNREAELDVGFLRLGIPDYSPRGFREAVMNALLHRDYGLLGSVVIQWRDDELEVSSAGGFVEGVRLDTLIVAGQRPRNPCLVQAMHRIGLAEQLGRGIDTIFAEQLRFGRPAPDYSRSTERGVSVVLPGGEANLGLVRFILSREQDRGPLSLADVQIVNAIDRERRIDIPRTSALLQRSEQAARGILERLVEDGILEARGERANRVYRFSADTYSALGDSASHVRGAGFDGVQHAAMVREYLLRNDRITRAGVADLCRLGSASAKALLQRMVADAMLVLHGQRRGAYYTLSPTLLKELTKKRNGTSKKRSKILKPQT